MVPTRLPGARPLRTLLPPLLRPLFLFLFLLLLALPATSAEAGCTRPPGHWAIKTGMAWPAPYSRNALFFSSGLTWQQVLDTPYQAENAYLLLAHHAIASMLSRASGAAAPFAVQSVLDNAVEWFSKGTTPASCGRTCLTQRDWAAILDLYDSGRYPGAPPLCTS